MVVAVRVLVGVSVIAQPASVAAVLNARQKFQASGYGDQRASLLALAAVAVLVLVGLTTVVVAAIHLWEVGGGWSWTWQAGSLLCLVAQGYALVDKHLAWYLLLAGLHAVAGPALSASLGPRRVAVRSPASGEPVSGAA